jgi:hypothetical protein
MLAVTYTKLGVFVPPLSELFAVKKYYWKVALVFLFSGIVLAFSIIPILFVFLSVVSLPPSRYDIFVFQLVVVLFCGPFSLGLLVLAPRWLMFYDSGVFSAIKFGFIEFLKNFWFYFLVSLVGFAGVISILYLLYLGDDFNWIRALISSFSAAWFSVMYTFAFLKNIEGPIVNRKS